MGLAVFLCFVPNIKVLVVRLLDSSINGTWIAPVDNLGNLHNMLYLFANSNTTAYLIVISLFWGAAGVFLYRMKIHKAIKVAILLIIVPLFYLTSVSVFVSMPFIWRLTSQSAYVVLFLVLLSFLVVCVLFGQHNNRLSAQLRIVLGWFWLPFIVMFVMSLELLPFNVPVFYDRYLIFISIAFCFQVAILANEFFRWRILSYVLSTTIIITWAVTVKPDLSNKRDAQETVELVAALNNDKTVVYFCPSWFDMNFTY